MSRADDLKLLDEWTQTNRLYQYKPYPKQLEFLLCGTSFIERMLSAGNQVGKSYTGAYETALHLTGLYPSWWTGLRFSHAPRVWAAGASNESVRDTAQTLLFGPPGIDELFGTGLIPRDLIIGQPTKSRGIADAIDTVRIRHVSGGVSILVFKQYTQDPRVWHGSTIDFIWFDEEPSLELYVEGQARLIATGGRSLLTFTPQYGPTEVVKRFFEADDYSHTRNLVIMGMDDAAAGPPIFGHMTPAKIEQTLSVYPKREWKARREGLPWFSEGSVFPSDAESIMCDPFGPNNQVPPWWFKIWGIDFGHHHPFGAVLCAWDKDADVFYVTHTIRTKGELPLAHADQMRRIAANVPVAWPHDGHRTESDGDELAHIYRGHRLSMLSTHATFKEGGYDTERGLKEMAEAMAAGRFKVGRNLLDWFQEYRSYHYDKDGKLVKIADDLMSATRIAWMMRRKAVQIDLGSRQFSMRRAAWFEDDEKPRSRSAAGPWFGGDFNPLDPP